MFVREDKSVEMHLSQTSDFLWIVLNVSDGVWVSDHNAVNLLLLITSTSLPTETPVSVPERLSAYLEQLDEPKLSINCCREVQNRRLEAMHSRP